MADVESEPGPRRSRLDIAIRLTLVALWLASLALPMGWSSDGTGRWECYVGPLYGYEALVMGWGGALAGNPGWFANALFFPALFLPGKSRSRRRLIISFATAVLLVACWVGAITWTSLSGINCEEQITPYGAGYVLWLVATGGAAVRLGFLAFSVTVRSRRTA